MTNFAELNPIIQALIAGIFTWLLTMLGSAFVFSFKDVNESFLAIMQGFAAVLGAAAVLLVSEILPYALAFAAGAIIFVVVEELIPESQGSNHTDDATLAFLLGFTVMMILDVALG